MKLLWAPWRMAFLAEAKQHKQNKASSCPFCEQPKNAADRDNLIIHRGQHCFIIMNLYPYNNGHLMVVPFKHEADITALSEHTLIEMNQLNAKAIKCLKNCFKPDGFNIGMNLGVAAGAGIPGHLHQHIIPRWIGDTNFMPILNNTRVMNEYLLDTYDRLKKSWPS